MEFILSNKGARKLVFDGYTFVKSRQVGNRIYWCCDQKRDRVLQCRGNVVTDIVNGREALIASKDHNHAPSQAAIEAKKLMIKVKELAKTTRDKPCVIINKAKECDQAVTFELPSVNAMRKTIQRQRKATVKETAI